MKPLDDPRHDREVGSRDATRDTTRTDDTRIGAVRARSEWEPPQCTLTSLISAQGFMDAAEDATPTSRFGTRIDYIWVRSRRLAPVQGSYAVVAPIEAADSDGDGEEELAEEDEFTDHSMVAVSLTLA